MAPEARVSALEHAPGKSARLELVCGQSDAPRGHPGRWDPRRGGAHPRHAAAARAAADLGVRVSVATHQDGGSWYSDAYLYFDPEQLPQVLEVLRRARWRGDVVDGPGAAHPDVTRAARRLGWEVG